MKAEIEFIYFDYAQLEHTVCFELVIYDDEGKQIFTKELNSVSLPKKITKYEREACLALLSAKTKLIDYWEE